MSFIHAAFIVLFLLGSFSAIYFCVSFMIFDARHRRMRKWPREQHTSYFQDLKRFPDEF